MNTAQPQSIEFKTPEETEYAFYTAIASGNMELMEQVWGEGTVLCVHPGHPLLQGRNTVMQSWELMFAANEQPALRVELLHRIERGDLCVHLVEESLSIAAHPESPTTAMLATNVYVCSGGGWRLHEHHASISPLNPLGSSVRQRGNETLQ